ncbi:TonB-dependent receptor [Mucilaginibacter sp. JRF]|uniref:TonB-dependent receptor n=1 Tax=Mucilaginibacter sp. JRF TaxID=2780088 RepID=UPI00187E6F94|nr:TonB-dependent receptor [Mucilaginibacter sp. JRF]MBE9586009.1 TonB-dependent receptor [Mucilaginibacter sp. JRF]
MKLTCLFIIVALLQVQAKSMAQRVTLSVKNASLSTIITQIKVQTDYDFVYNNSAIEGAKPITISANDLDLKTVLDQCFKGQPFTYSIVNKVIVLNRKQVSEPTHAAEKPVADVRITGVVRDSVSGETLPGVSVNVEGTTLGVISDNGGAFTLNVPSPTSVLVLTYIGYKSQRVPLNGKTVFDIRMAKADAQLSEVVVVGYGTRAKGAVTGAISSVKSEVFENRPMTSSVDALQGTIPGLTITRPSGQPGLQGGNYGFQVRGYSSINGNAPLVLIDNVPSDINTFATLNPNDIADVSVLKDAAAAIYGARAADGVIIVTTKRGKKGTPQITYTGNFGIKTPTYLRKMQNTLQFAEFMDEGLRNAGINGFSQEVFDKIRANAAPDLEQGWNYGVTNFPGFYGYTDWNDAIYKNATQQLHSLSVSGGGDNNNYLVSVGYNRDNGIVRYGDNSSDRYNLRLNYDIRPSSKINIETRTNFDNQANVNPTLLGSALTNVTRQFPYAPVYNPQGQFYGYQGYENPAQYLEEGGTAKGNLSRFATNFKLDYTVLPGLKLTGQAAFRFEYNNTSATSPTITRYNYAGGVQDIRQTPNSAAYANSKRLNKLYQLYFDYNKDIGTDHHINLTGGGSLEQTRNEGQNVTGYNFASNDIFTLNLADRTKAAYANFSGLLNNQALASYFGRASYSYKNKLIVDLTARADGSSKFAPDQRWSALFPSAAIAYNLSEESFIKKTGIFNQLKTRVSWGRMGNQEIGALGLYDYIPLVTVGGTYPIGSPNAGVPGANAGPASTNRTWETIENRNVGIDVAVLDSRLSFSFDYFNKINNDMLVNVAVPATFGATPPSANLGKLVTKGFEATATWKDKINDFRYSVAVQISDSRNKLVELKNSDNYGEGLNFTRQGYPIYSYFGYVYDGIIQTQAQLDAYKQLQGVPSRLALGDVMYKDVDGDGRLTAFGDRTRGLAGDMVYLGNVNPRYTFSSNISLGYKQFDLAVFLQGVGKRDVIYEGNISRPNTFFWPSLEYYYGKTWSPERTDAQYPRYIPGNLGFDDINGYNYRPSANVLHSVAYLRFKVITLGYNLPVGVAKSLQVRSARVYVSGQDLFTISKGTLGGNFDPEDGYRNEGTYPFNKVYSLGLNVSF